MRKFTARHDVESARQQQLQLAQLQGKALEYRQSMGK